MSLTEAYYGCVMNGMVWSQAHLDDFARAQFREREASAKRYREGRVAPVKVVVDEEPGDGRRTAELYLDIIGATPAERAGLRTQIESRYRILDTERL